MKQETIQKIYMFGIMIGVVLIMAFIIHLTCKEEVIIPISGDIATSTATSTDPFATSTEEVIEPEPTISVPVLPITQVEDEWIEGKDQYNKDGLLVSQVLEAEDIKLKKDKLSEIKEDLLPVQFEDTDLPEAEVLTLYVRGIGIGTATLMIGDDEIITLTMKDKEWLTKWDSVNVSAFGVSRFTQGQINNARLDFTGDIKVSNVRLYAEDQHSLTDSFDSYTDGDLNGQGSWSGNAIYDIQGTITQGSSVKAVYASVTSGSEEVSKTFSEEANGEQFWYMYMPDNTSQSIHVYINDGANVVAGVGLVNGNIQSLLKVGDWVNIGTFSADTWYKVNAEWRDSDGYVQITIDDGTPEDWAESYHTWAAADTIRLSGYLSTGYWDGFNTAGAPPVVEDDAGSQDIIWFD